MHKQIAILLLTTALGAIASLPNQVIGSFGGSTAIAATPEQLPAGLASAIAALDKAASSRDLDTVMKNYSDNFVHGDGLTKQKLRESLETLWQRYKQIQYRTEVTKLEVKGENYNVQTKTQIKGTQGEGESKFELIANLQSTQVYQNKNNTWQVIRQDIISEKSLLTSGEKPPSVELRIPDTIGIGRQYALDAIVLEPVGVSLLLGAAIEETVNPANYVKEATIDLEALKSGGIFKIGQAPYSEGDRWISVVLVRENGVSITSQRIRVSKDAIGKQYTPLPDSGTVQIRIPADPKNAPSL
jgi:ketosteroid isomerase-like protein